MELLTESTVVQVAQSDLMKTQAHVVKRMAAVVSKVLEVGMEAMELSTDLVTIGSWSLSLLLDLTVHGAYPLR